MCGDLATGCVPPTTMSLTVDTATLTLLLSTSVSWPDITSEIRWQLWEKKRFTWNVDGRTDGRTLSHDNSSCGLIGRISSSLSSSSSSLSSSSSSSSWTLSVKTLSVLALYNAKIIIVPHAVGTVAVDGWAVTFGTARRGLDVAAGPSSLYQM